MKFNLTPLESFVFLFLCLAIYIWTKHGRRIRRWLQDWLNYEKGAEASKL